MQRKRLVWIPVVVVAASVASLLSWRFVGRSRATPLEAVRKQLEQATPVGSSRSAVDTYLDSQSIPHSYIRDSKSPSEGGVELALIRGTSKSLLVRGDIQIRFRFDESERLVSYSVQEGFTGP